MRKTRKHYLGRSGLQTNKRKPGDDFYTYINHGWLEKTEIPPTKSSYGVSEEVENTIDKETEDLLQECKKQSKSEKKKTYLESIESMLGTLATSVVTANTQEENLKTTFTILTSIQSLTSKEEVAVIMGEFARYKIHSLFAIYGQYENKNKTRYTYTIGAGGLGLPDPSFYHERSLQRGKYFASYKHMIGRLGELFHIPKLHCVVQLEKIIAGVLLRTNYELFEYEKTGNELEKEFTQIPFSILFETIGLENWKNTTFFVESVRWLHTINNLFRHLGLDYWRLLLSLEFISFCLPWLPPSYSDISFQFYKKQLRGQNEKLSREKQSVYVVQQYATPFFSRLYVEKIVDKSIKPHVTVMVDEFLHVAERRIGAIEWLEPKTREKAQEKVKKMRYIVAYPDQFEHHTLPKLKDNNVLFNLLQLGDWQTQYEIQKLNQPISQRKEWDDEVFAVNAYYYAQANEMVIPSGVLQTPFYNKDASIAWNYGGLGCILCHEMTHAFDKEGKEYDPEGFQKKWWAPTDNRKYNQQTKALIDLYGKQHIYGFPVSGRRTLSENIADIGGMGIALDALKEKLNRMKLTEEERKQSYKDFFTSYAISWRVKEKKKKRIQALIMDKHAAPILRVNLVVSQFQEWYDAFDVGVDDKLYIPPEKRIQIF